MGVCIPLWSHRKWSFRARHESVGSILSCVFPVHCEIVTCYDFRSEEERHT